ncbi:hypothetical protein ACJMK2_019370 [Sinanodonta woodiana]|uniref:Uncharacterized protein n=1 Tax=Sinanodonta woodiana TaxID=1069815 RepID=A0ABD3UG70_SINWO
MHLFTATSLLLCHVYGALALKEGTVSQTAMEVYASKEETPCNVTIQNKTGIYMLVKFAELHPDVAHLTLIFPQNSTVTWNDGALQPFRWMWSLNEDRNSIPFIQWHVDYSILSFGLLDTKALPESFVLFDVQPPDCSINIGSSKSDLEIAYAFSNMTHTFLEPVSLKYRNSYWCFAAEIPGVKDTFLYKLGIHFGYPVEVMTYNCCYSYFHFTKDRLDVNCSRKQSETMHDTTSRPYFMGLILFCYFPILLLSFASSTSDTTKASSDKCIWRQNGYVCLDHNEDQENVYFDANTQPDFVYLENKSPISLTSMFCGLCGQANRFPNLVSRLRRTIFVLFCPIVIYIKLIIYTRLQNETTLELINHGVPVNFLSMLGGFQRSRELFVPFLGGPFVLIILFYTISAVLIIFPENMEHVLEDGTSDSAWTDACPLTLGLDSVQNFSHVQISSECGFAKIRASMIGRFYCILNPKFWSYTCCVSLARYGRVVSYVKLHIPIYIRYIVYSVLIPVLVLTFFTEMLLCLLYYGIPLPWFICIAFTAFGNAWIRIYRERLGLRLTNVSSYCTIVVGYLLLVPVLFYFSYSTIMIFSTSFNFVAEIIVFVFIAVIVYPSTAFGYLFFGTALFYYVLKQLRGIGETYFELLSDVVEVLMILKAEPDKNRVVDGTLTVPKERNSTIQMIQINGSVKEVLQEQSSKMSSTPTPSSDCLLHYKNNVPGIPKDLFRYVLQRHRPVFITVFKAFLRIGLIVLLLLGTLRITSYAPSTSSQVTEVMHVIFIVMIGSLPRALEVTFSDSNKVVMKEMFLKQLERTILIYKRDSFNETQMDCTTV